jgi:hypothetical protein
MDQVTWDNQVILVVNHFQSHFVDQVKEPEANQARFVNG